MINTEKEYKKIYSCVCLDKKLVDKRIKSYGFIFGTVKQISEQYGISISTVKPDERLIKRAKKFNKNLKICFEFSAPQSRLDKLIEKLHFSMVKYSKVPFFI